MIQMQTYLNVADNSGAKIVQCIKVLGGSHKNTAGIGEIIVVAVKDAIPNAPVKKGDVQKLTTITSQEKELPSVLIGNSFLLDYSMHFMRKSTAPLTPNLRTSREMS